MRKGERTRQAIIYTAARLFESRGFYSTGIDDIARELHIAKGTMYQYFKDKNELFRVIVQDATVEVDRRLDALKCEVSNLQELIVAIMVEINRFNVEEYDYFTIHLAAGSSPSDPEMGTYSPMRQMTAKIGELLWPYRDELVLDIGKSCVAMMMATFACRAFLLEMIETPRDQVTEEQIRAAAVEFGDGFLKGYAKI